MTIAVDTSALIAIFKGEASAPEWMEIIIKIAPSGTLVANDIVWAEIAPLFPTFLELRRRMDDLGIIFDPVSDEASFLAGQSFAAYRRAGGPREHLIPDFLVAAHALQQAEGLIAADRGYLRRYFKRLRLHTI